MQQTMKKFSIATLWILFACAACHQSKPPPPLVLLSVGMSKAEVISITGRPDKVSVDGNVEILEYEAYDETGDDFIPERRNHRWSYVRLIDGVVDTFGTKADFDNPTVRVKVDEHTTTHDDAYLDDDHYDDDDDESKRFDLASELKYLDKLKADGVITDDEYAELRKSAINKAKAQ